jgi:hypothetical protein
VGWSSPIEFL